MYSVPPAIVSLLFLSYGFYVVFAIGVNRITVPFFLLCLTTFAWQATWSVLFQTSDPDSAYTLIRLGWCLILFLPTSLYHFLSEVCFKRDEIPFVYLSYLVCSGLVVVLLGSDLLISGYYDYFFGFYPKAGLLHGVHVAHTVVVVTRGLWITYKKYCIVQGQMRVKLGFCIVGILIYFFAATDYLCNYGIEFYPLGVVFILVSLGIIAFATAKYHVMDDIRLLFSSAVHDMKTPLATASIHVSLLGENMPKLLRHYRRTQTQVQSEDLVEERFLEHLEDMPENIDTQLLTIKGSIDSFMSIVSYQHLNGNDFHVFFVNESIETSIRRIPQCYYENIPIHFSPGEDFNIFASRSFLIQVFINIINNALDAVRQKGSGEIYISTNAGKVRNTVTIRDTGFGIEPKNQPHIFDDHFTTKKRGTNSGIGLAFCKNVMKKFKGDIVCESALGEYTSFDLLFPIHRE